MEMHTKSRADKMLRSMWIETARRTIPVETVRQTPSLEQTQQTHYCRHTTVDTLLQTHYCRHTTADTQPLHIHRNRTPPDHLRLQPYLNSSPHFTITQLLTLPLINTSSPFYTHSLTSYIHNLHILYITHTQNRETL